MLTLYNMILMRLARLLANGVSDLREFEDWFIPNTWGAEKLNDRRLNELVDQMSLLFLERSQGHWSDEEVMQGLLDLFREHSPYVLEGFLTASNSTTVPLSLFGSLCSFSDTRSEEVVA